MIASKIFALAVQEMGIEQDIVILGSIFAIVFIISFGWVTKGSETRNYGRFQQRNSSKS